MSSPRHSFLSVPAAILGVLPLCAFAFDPPPQVQRSPEPAAVAPSAPSPNSLAELACTVCDFRPALDLLLKPPPNLQAESAAVQTGDVEAPEVGPVAMGTSWMSKSPDRVAPLAALQFRDNEPLINRLKRVQAWPLLTLWDSSAATLYVGLDKHGEPGVHLRQKRSDRGTVLPRGRLVLIASPDAPSETVTSEVTPAKR
jgi:hypothetical protein